MGNGDAAAGVAEAAVANFEQFRCAVAQAIMDIAHSPRGSQRRMGKSHRQIAADALEIADRLIRVAAEARSKGKLEYRLAGARHHRIAAKDGGLRTRLERIAGARLTKRLPEHLRQFLVTPHRARGFPVAWYTSAVSTLIGVLEIELGRRLSVSRSPTTGAVGGPDVRTILVILQGLEIKVSAEAVAAAIRVKKSKSC